jgi:hypothetical protein
MTPLRDQLVEIAHRFAAGDRALDGISSEAIEALHRASRDIDKVINVTKRRQARSIPIRVAVALAQLDGVPIAPHPVARVRYAACGRCKAGVGQRCRQTGGMPCPPHKGREVIA